MKPPRFKDHFADRGIVAVTLLRLESVAEVGGADGCTNPSRKCSLSLPVRPGLVPFLRKFPE